MIGKRSASIAIATALLIVGAGTAYASDELPYSDTSLVQVFVDSQEDVDALSSQYDLAEYKHVEDDGTIELNIDTTVEERSELRAAGFRIGNTIENAATRRAVAEARDATTAAVNLADDLAENGAPAGGIKLEGKSVVPTPGETVIQRTDRFTNYAGTFLYVEAHSKAHTTNSGPTQSVSIAGADGVFGAASTLSKFNDAGQYMYHYLLIRLSATQAAIPVADLTVRVASSSGAIDTAKVTEWLGTGLPPHADGYQTGFFAKYQDPTENRAQLDRLAAEYPNLVTPVNLPHLTNGYQRKSQAMMNGTASITTTYSQAGGNNPTPAQIEAYNNNAGRALVLTTKAWGHEGGDLVTAEFKNPGVADSPLSVAVTGTDVVVNLATDAGGALKSTAAEVIAALNSSPDSSALLTAMSYRGHIGDRVVNPRAKVSLDDFLNAPSNIQRGPFQQRVYRIGSVRDGSKVGVFIYCQQHAREWATGLTCVETAERLVKNYATDPETKTLLDDVEVFIIANVNPDGGHYSMYDYASQRKNMTNHCAITGSSDPGARNGWGVDLNRNNGSYSGFDGYSGGGTNCTGETFQGPAENSEPEIKNEQWVVDTFENIKFANNVHSYGGYFMWAPGSYISAGRVTAPAPNIGVEKYFFEAGEKILRRIKDYRNTVILPERTGPIADVLYSAAGNSADDQWYRKGIISYSFETGADRFSSTTSGTSRNPVGFQPNFASEGSHEAMEFAAGNFGLVESAYDYAKDTTAPSVSIEYSAAQTSGDAINYKFNWDNEAAVIHYTTDGSTPTLSSPTYNAQRARGLGEVLTLATPGAYTIKWIAKDMKGNVSAVKTQRLLVAADDETGTVGGSVGATLALSLGAPASFAPFIPGVDDTYTAGTTATVVSTAGEATLSVADPSSVNTGKLMNGTFTLAQALQAQATSAGGTGSAFAPVGGSASPTTLLTYAGPKSNDMVAVSFRQTIGRTEGLRTGAYTKTLTFTLSTTQP